MKTYWLLVLLVLSKAAFALDGLWFYEDNFREDGQYQPRNVIDFNNMVEISPGRESSINYLEGKGNGHFSNAEDSSEFIILEDENTLVRDVGSSTRQRFYRAIPIAEENASEYMVGTWSWDSKICGDYYFSYDLKAEKVTFHSSEYGDDTLAIKMAGNIYIEQGPESTGYYRLYYVPALQALVSETTALIEDGVPVPPADLDWRKLWEQQCY